MKALVFGVIKDKRDCGELGDMPVSSGTGIRGEGRDGWQGSCQELTGCAGPWARAKKHGLCGESGVWEGFTQGKGGPGLHYRNATLASGCRCVGAGPRE